jgi:hypothetical protein
VVGPPASSNGTYAAGRDGISSGPSLMSAITPTTCLTADASAVAGRPKEIDCPIASEGEAGVV